MKELFRSGVSYEILKLFSKNIDSSYSLSEIASKINEDKGNITRELKKLSKEGIVKEVEDNTRKEYIINKSYEGIDDFVSLINKRESDNFKDKFDYNWLMAEDIPNMDPYFSQMWAKCFVNDFKEPSGRAYKRIAIIHEDYHLWINFEESDAYGVAEHLVNRFIENPSFMKKINEEIIRQSDRLVDFSDTVPEDNLSSLSDKELWNINKKHLDLHSEYYQWTWIPAASDMFSDILTNKGKEILKSTGVSDDDINDKLTVMTQPTRPSLLKVEQDELKFIGIKIQKNKEQRELFEKLFKEFKEEDVREFGLYNHSPKYERALEKKVMGIIDQIHPEILDDLQDHYKKYFYTKFIFTEEQGVYSFEHYLKELVRLVSKTPNIEKELKEENEELELIQQEKNKIIKDFDLSKKYQTFFKEWGEFMITKIYRRYAQLYALYKITYIIEEIGKRLGLSLKETRFLEEDEMKKSLLRNNPIDTEELKKRMKSSVYYADKSKNGFIRSENTQKAIEMIRGKEEDYSNIKELEGQTGCRGHAIGIAKIVNFSDEIQKVNKGDILISISTQPDLLPAMKKAAAFVTEQGGVTSHAAIVAREMNKPCVIGTKIATKVIKDGMKVEVNATKGIVRILDKE